jgi:hypothetical protein
MDSALSAAACVVGTLSDTALGRAVGFFGAATHGAFDYAAHASGLSSLRVVGYQYLGSERACSGGVLTEGQVALINSQRDERCERLLADCYGPIKQLAQNIHYDTHNLPRATYRCVVPKATTLSRLDGFRSYPYSGGNVPPALYRTRGVHPWRGDCDCVACHEAMDNAIEDPARALEVLGMTLQSALREVDEDKYPRCFGHVLSSAYGTRQLTVIDLTVPTALIPVLNKLLTSFNATPKAVPSHFTDRIRTSVDALAVDNGWTVGQATCALMSALTVFACMCADTASVGQHTMLTDIEDVAYVPEPGPSADLEDMIDEVNKELNAYDDNGIPMRPATELTGDHAEGGIVAQLDEDELLRWEGQEPTNELGGIKTGPNLFGKNMPLDTKDPRSMLSAYTRHLCDFEVKLPTDPNDNTKYYTFKMRKFTDTRDLRYLKRVWDDIAAQDKATFEEMLADGSLAPVLEGPSSMTEDAFYEALQATETQQDNNMKSILGTLFNKRGEDGDRARFVTMPGRLGSDKLHHARMAPMIKALEHMHKEKRNHRHVKGQDEEARRHALGDFLRGMGKGKFLFSTDKKSNDRCWTLQHWEIFLDYLDEVTVSQFKPFMETYCYTRAPTEQADLKHKYCTFVLSAYLLYYFSGINPTSFGNRLMSEAEAGVLTLTIFGEEAYAKWLADRIAQKESDDPFWISGWKHGTKLQHAHVAPVSDMNEGDDKAIALESTAKGVELSCEQLADLMVTNAGKYTGFAYEIAFMPHQELNCGRKSVGEFCSIVFGLPAHGVQGHIAPAVIVPKPLKALNKAAWSSTLAVTYVRDTTGRIVNVVHDDRFHRYAATKLLALSIINYESPFVGKYLLACAEHHLGKLTGPDSRTTLYDNRDPEARGLEEWSATTFQDLEKMHAKAQQANAITFAPRDLHVALQAWRIDLPLKGISDEVIIHALLALDDAAASFEVSDRHITDPGAVFSELPFGALLKPLLQVAERGYRKLLGSLVKMQDVDRARTVEEVKEALRPITKGATNDKKDKKKSWSKSASSAESKNPEPAPDGKGTANADGHVKRVVNAWEKKGKGKGKGNKGKGKSHAHPPNRT